jgi:hypothetical protein
MKDARHPSRRSYSGTALSNTCEPAAHSLKLVDSASSREMLPGQGAVDGGYAFG